MVICCFSDEPLSADEMSGKYGAAYGPFAAKTSKYDITMCQAPCRATGCWCVSIACLPCAQIKMRYKVLNHVDPSSGWKNYECCQGKFGGVCCCQPGKCGEKTCPRSCMCLEGCCCPGLAASVNSMLIREKYGLGLDADDIRLIRCSNCLQMFACIVNLIGCFCDWDGEATCRAIVNGVADVTFCCVAGCMTAQTNHEIEKRIKEAPQGAAMER